MTNDRDAATTFDDDAADSTESADAPDLMRDLDRPNAYQLFIGGTPQSHVDLDDPTYLEFEYVRRLGHVIDLCAPPGAPLRALHLGGGGLTLARYVAVTRPGSGQQVVEIDATVIEFVRKELPLPRNARIRLRNGDGRDVLSRVPEGAFDLTVTDVFEASRVPAAFNSVEYVGLSARALRPGGIHAVNLADGGATAGLGFTRSQIANALEHFAQIVLIADPGVLKGRRFGNVILLASNADLPVDGLVRRTASDPFPGRVLHGAELKAFAAGGKPVHDADAVRSPERPGDMFGRKKR